MSKKLFLILFLSILFLGTFLRFYQLGNVPASLEWDEVSYGYNAYAILQTGKDEYGETMPFAFRAFGEYKQPVYMYLDVLSVQMFGLNAFAVRFPSALFGSLSILFVFLLVYELFRKFTYAKTLALLSMLFFAVSPWSIQFSRAAFEATVSLCFVIAAVWLFLRGLRLKERWYFIVAMLLLTLSTYTYISQKVFVPLLFTTLILFGFQFFKKQKVFAGIIVVVFLILNSLWLFDTKSVSRGQGVFITNQQSAILDKSIGQMQYDLENNDSIGALLHNRRIVYTQAIVSNYLSHFDPVWLFFTGDEVKRHHAPGVGQLYLVSLPLILAGIYFLLSRAFAMAWILFAWLLFAPVAAALTFESPHALRSLIFLPTWHIFEAAGVVFLLQTIRKQRFVKPLLIFVILLFAGNMFYFLHQYFVHTDTDHQKDWQYGYREAIESLNVYNDSNKRVIFSNNFEQPHIFYLFYTQYDPEKYIASGGSSRTAKECFAIERVHFGKCLDKLRDGDIYVAAENAEISDTKEVKRFEYQNGDPATRIFEYK